MLGGSREAVFSSASEYASHSPCSQSLASYLDGDLAQQAYVSAVSSGNPYAELEGVEIPGYS